MGDKKDLFITVELGDVKNGKVEITEEKFHFSGTKTDGKKEVKYKIDFTFKNPVNAKESIHAFKDREVEIKVRKKDVKADFWLLMYSKEDKKIYKSACKCDWDLWRDEDDDGQKPGMGDFGIGPGREFDSESDEDSDDDIPEL